MIDPKDFYHEHEKMTSYQKQRVWHRVSRSIKPQFNKIFSFELRSFAFGSAAGIILLLAVVGFFAIIQNSLYESQPELMKLNKIYKNTISEMEEIIPSKSKLKNASVIVDEKITGKKDKLANIDLAINEIYSGSRFEIYSSIKQERLLKLYRMKLQVIEEIISIEEKTR